LQRVFVQKIAHHCNIYSTVLGTSGFEIEVNTVEVNNNKFLLFLFFYYLTINICAYSLISRSIFWTFLVLLISSVFVSRVLHMFLTCQVIAEIEPRALDVVRENNKKSN